MSILKYITLADVVTVINALVGFLAIMYVIDKLYINALILILLAIILDGLDGIMARVLKAKHTFGIFLDAIADTVSFCFAPAVLLYGLYYIPTESSFTSTINFLTVLATFFVAGLGILRLARFITIKKKRNYFIGLPTPALALFIVILHLPMYATLITPEFLLVIITLTSILMVSDVVYPKLKGPFAIFSGALIGLVILTLIIDIGLYWMIQLTTFVFAICYIFILPFLVYLTKYNWFSR